MKNIEKIKFICGLTLVLFPILAGLILYLYSFENFYDVAASNVPIFLGLCGLSGAYLLASVKPSKIENKPIEVSNQPEN